MDEYRPFPAQQPADAPAGVAPPPGEAAPDQREVTGAESYEPQDATDDPVAETRLAAPDTGHPGGQLRGTVARLNRPRRFGFLRADDGAEVFFHASALEAGPAAFDALRPGQEVEFACHQDEQGRGLAASRVAITGEPPVEAPRPRPARQERAGRGGRTSTAGASDKWHVAVLHDGETPAATQLERLLNERSVRPGNITIALVDTEDGTECWLAYYTGDEPRH